MFLRSRKSEQGANLVLGGIVALCPTTARVEGAISTSGNNLIRRRFNVKYTGRGKCSHINPYAASHTTVLFQPFFHKIISSIRSCNQNKGPTLATNRRKFVVMVERERGSPVLKYVCEVCPALGVEVVPNTDPDAFKVIDAADVGIDDDRSSWGIIESADLDGDEAVAGLLRGEATMKGKCLIVASGKEVSILSAGRTEWLSRSSGDETSRVASAGMSTYSKVDMEVGGREISHV